MVEGVMCVDTEGKGCMLPQWDVPHEAYVPYVLAGPVERRALRSAQRILRRYRKGFLLSPLHRASAPGTRTHELVGNLLIVIGCFGSAFYNVYSKRLLDYFSGSEVLFFSYLSTTVFSLPVLFALEPHCLYYLAHLTFTQWAAFGYLAVFLYGLSMLLFLRALGMVDVVIASASLYLMPLFGVALAFSILGERLAPRTLLGSAIVLFATAVLFRFDYAF